MEEIEAQRRFLQKRFEKLKEELLVLMRNEPVDKEELAGHHAVFCEAYQSLSSWDKRALQKLRENGSSEEDLLQEAERIDSYNAQAKILKIKIEKMTSDFRTDSSNSVTEPCGSSSNGTKKTCRLPNVEIKKFDGRLTEWLSFWAQFKRIHENQDLHDSDKFWYLVDALETGTEVYELVKGYPQSEEHYPVVIEVLKKRYSNDVLLQVYIRELLGLVISNLRAKEKLPFDQLFVKIDSYLRSLKSLNVERADPATWLFPLVESSLPDDILISWQRSSLSKEDGSKLKPPQSRLDLLLKFLDEEVQIRHRVDLSHSFSRESTKSQNDKPIARKDSIASKKSLPTVANFHVTEKEVCAFCGRNNHKSIKCYKAMKMSHSEKMAILKKHGLCYICCAPHLARNCNASVTCRHCNGHHETVICNAKTNQKRKIETPKADEEGKFYKKQKTGSSTSTGIIATQTHLNQVISSQVFLQTLYCQVISDEVEINARTFIDLGSQRSYLKKAIASTLQLNPVSQERVIHSLFGGMNTKPILHSKYDIVVGSLFSTFKCTMQVRDKEEICEPLSRISQNKIGEFGLEGVHLNDVGMGAPPIDLLIGADQFGKIMTGEVKDFGNGLFGINTKLGWTIIGEMQSTPFDSSSLCMSIHDKQLPHLWDLEVIGIKDPLEVMKSKDFEEKLHKDFVKNMSRNADGRYVVSLPWKNGHPDLPTNKKVAVKRLQSTTKKLVQSQMFQAYDKLFTEWLSEGFIEEVVNPNLGEKVHYLPHRAVIKASLTTPVRPVFDASCKEGKNPSLNDCLQKGCNFIALIPHLLLRFREKTIGFVSDIRKAFQQIEVVEKDRDSFRFLWWRDLEKKNLIEYRHVRVPFGATCSPFILGAVIKFHLENCNESDRKLAKMLLDSFYVDNCVNSVNTAEEYESFKENGVRIMQDAQMDLRLWMSNRDEKFEKETEIISVLGVMWNRKDDILFIETSKISCPERITKRTTLSSLNKIFDPFGFTCPIVVQVKILLQRVWARKLKWDDELPEDEQIIMQKWYKEIAKVSLIHLPRHISALTYDEGEKTLHVFVDASQHSFATVIFLRAQIENITYVSFLSAKTRIAPPGKRTIPRMELLAALIGTNLCSSIKESLRLDDIPTIYWSDSTTVLAWIKRNDTWGTFVGNRVNKILSYSRGENWHYVPSSLNAADLPSRGCSPIQLLDSKWWEGPSWLYQSKDTWPMCTEIVNESEVLEEKRKDVVCLSFDVKNHLKRSHSFKNYTRIFGWVDRFLRKVRKQVRETDNIKELSPFDEERGEIRLLQFVQNQFFTDEQVKRLKHLETIRDENNILRVKTRITERDDEYNFKYPVLLPGNHSIVKQLIYDFHGEKAHAGVGIMLTSLREKYWILRSRQSVKKVICNCYRCGRYAAKATQTPTAPLPLNRIKDSEPFEVTGVDLAGPLNLRNGKKVWMVIYTCAVYRAVHLQAIQSLSTKAFIKSMMKFVQRFRRPSIVYSDNGTNFKGTDNLFAKINWNEVTKETGLTRINWIFNPSTGSWWGGFWERLIRTVKDLLRKTLSNAVVKLQELKSVLWTVEKAMNQRPLTYVSESSEDLEPLTPEMFINPYGVVDFPEAELTDGERLRFRFTHVNELRNRLKERFRKEYLSMLVSRVTKTTRPLRVGELVLLSSDNKKRLDWPLARILELVPSKKDGVSRVARVKTKDGIYVRPVQRLYQLEADSEPETSTIMKKRITRSGREVRTPQRYH